MKKEEILKSNILALSTSPDWDTAKDEWSLDTIFFEENYTKCLCSHYPIVECCVLKNNTNQNTTIVGNCCVKKFTDLPSGLIFDAVKKVREDNKKSLNKNTLQMAYEKKWITNLEYGFYMDVMFKKKLSVRQKAMKEKLNKQILKNIE